VSLLPVHIIAGSIAIVAGFISVFALKGAKLHRKSGMIFVYSMLVLSTTGAVIATLKHQTANIIGGSLAFYMVTTALLTVRARDRGSRWADAASLVIGTAVGGFAMKTGSDAMNTPTGTSNGVPAGMMFFFGAVALLAAIGDLRVLLVGELQGAQRIARHLWRMCFSLFIASGSFFLGQAKVIPKPIRILPLLAIPALLPLALLLYWLARVLLTKWYRRRADASKPTLVGHSPQSVH
jgi:uncharacterized membrane protein